MENKIQVFTNEKFGKVRTLMINNEPWFVGKDVAEILGYKEASKAVRQHVDEDDKGGSILDTPGGKQNITIINESGLYSLILSSKLPTAKKFKRWVTSEVLPSIRKTGGYSLEIPKDYPSALRALADQCEINRIMKPKADFYDTVASTESLLSMNDTAKILNMGVGRNKLFKLLRDKKILMKDNMPYQRYVDAGYFKVVESYYMAGDNSVVSKTTYVRQRGVDYIRKLLNECA